jgi:hypothetical protein
MTFIKPDATLSFTSRMEDNIQWACVKAGEFPRVGLMVLSVCHGRWTMMGMGGISKVTSTPLAPLHFLGEFYGSSHLAQISHLGFSPSTLPALRFLKLSSVLFSLTAMPQECGNNNRGHSWYSYAVRKGHICKLAQTSSTSLIRCDREKKLPPMAYVEEEFPEEPITVLLDSLLYTVLDPQDQPNTSLPSFSTECAMEGVTCII